MPDHLERLRDALADRYAVESEIGRGGMATVFLAEDLKHRRQVAIKVLHPELAATLGPERFLREIEIAAGLNHPHILPLFDSGEAAGLLYYVMPYVEGESLREKLVSEGQLPIDQAVAIAAEVAEGLDYAHRQGVIHRDIKPGNILLSEGHALIADFGLARAVDAASEGKAPAIGLAVGTPDYMSPEQGAADTTLDGRTDVYALGCVLWEMLAGEPPFSGPTPQVILARKAMEEAPDVRAIRSRVPEALEMCLEGALAPAPADRFATAAGFASALREAVLLGVTPQAVARRKRRRRRHWVLAGLAVVVAIGGVLAWRAFAKQRQVQWARTEAMPEILRLTNEGKHDSALYVARLLESSLTSADTVHIPWGFFSWDVTIETDPPGTRVYWRLLDDVSGADWQFLGTAPMEGVRLPDTAFGYRFEKEGYETRELRWSGQMLGLVGLDLKNSTPPGMVRVHWWRIESDFHLDRFEVTNRQYQEFVAAGGYESEEYWTEPFVLDGRTVSWEEAMSLLVDGTGHPGPSTWGGGSYEEGYEDFPVGGLSWYEAVAFARYSGKTLPSHWHLRLAMRAGTLFQMIPRSNLDGIGPQAVGASPTEGPFGAFDQYGNVREWTYNTSGEGRVAFGGSWTDTWDATDDGSQILSPWDRSPENGLRLVLHPDTARLTRWSEPIDPPEPMRDYWSESPADDAEYEVLARVYDYEAAELSPLVELADTVYGWPMERVSFTGPDGTSRMGVFLFLPRGGRPPFQTVLYFNGYAQQSPVFPPEHILMFDSFLRTGRAIALPILYGTYEPYDPEKGVEEDLDWQTAETAVRWVKELIRTIDYLESRPEIDHRRIAYFGQYFGTTHAPIVLALEPRIKVAFAESGALDPWSAFPPYADPFHFLSRVRTPFLLINTRYSMRWPYEESQLPMLEYLGTPEEHKRLVTGDYTDPVQFPDIYPVVHPWFDRYLGSVEGF